MTPKHIIIKLLRKEKKNSNKEKILKEPKKNMLQRDKNKAAKDDNRFVFQNNTSDTMGTSL